MIETNGWEDLRDYLKKWEQEIEIQWAEVGVGFMTIGWLIRAGLYWSAARRGRVTQPPAGLYVRVR